MTRHLEQDCSRLHPWLTGLQATGNLTDKSVSLKNKCHHVQLGSLVIGYPVCDLDHGGYDGGWIAEGNCIVRSFLQEKGRGAPLEWVTHES